MNIAIGKFGKSIKFNYDSWGAAGGESDAACLYTSLFHNNPDKTFYLIGKSDFSKLPEHIYNDLNIHNNVIDIWKDFAMDYDLPKWEFVQQSHRYIDKMMSKLPQIDRGIFVSGPVGSANVAGFTKLTTKNRNDEYARPLTFSIHYAAPIIWFLNKTNIPYILINNDPNYSKTKAYDLFNQPKHVFSQINEHIKFKVCDNYESKNKININQYHTYAPVASASLIGRKNEILYELSIFDKPIIRDKFVIVLNQGGSQIEPRYPILNDFILKEIKDVEIYGKWREPKAQPNYDKRFKGSIPYWDLQRKLQETKYTYCIPIMPGWSTLKFWECAHAGIIPFMHPTYDSQKNIKCDEFLRVKSSKDLFNKIEYLDNNPDYYEYMLNHLKTDILTNDIYSGKLLNSIIMNKLENI